MLRAFRGRNDRAPVFLFGERSHISSVPLSTLKMANEFIWLTRRHSHAHGGPVEAAIRRYREHLLPPMFSAMLKHADVHEYAFGTPGHLGGTAFLKTPVSKVFFDYFGENLFRSDLSIGMAAVGSLLDHSGPIGESEKYAARVFGAHRSYTVTNGTSTSNRIMFMACLTRERHCALRSQLPQVHRARPDDDRRDSRLPGAAPQSLRHHRTDLSRRSAAGDGREQARRAIR